MEVIKKEVIGGSVLSKVFSQAGHVHFLCPFSLLVLSVMYPAHRAIDKEDGHKVV